MTNKDLQEQTKVMDLEVYEDLHAVMEDGFHEILMEFIHDTPSILNNLSQAISYSDFEKIFLISHSLYGTSGNLGIIHLSILLKNIQQMAKSENIEDCIQAGNKIEAAFKEAKEELLKRIKKL